MLKRVLCVFAWTMAGFTAGSVILLLADDHAPGWLPLVGGGAGWLLGIFGLLPGTRRPCCPTDHSKQPEPAAANPKAKTAWYILWSLLSVLAIVPAFVWLIGMVLLLLEALNQVQHDGLSEMHGRWVPLLKHAGLLVMFWLAFAICFTRAKTFSKK